MSATDPELWAESDSGEESFDSLSEAALKSLEKRYMSYNTTLIPSSRRLLIGCFNASKDRLAPDFAPFGPFHFQYPGWSQHCQCTTRWNAEGSARHGYAISNRSLHYGELNPGPVCVCVWISPRRDPEQRSSHSTSPVVIHTLPSFSGAATRFTQLRCTILLELFLVRFFLGFAESPLFARAS